MNKVQSQITGDRSLSVVLATRNEEANIARCLESVKSVAAEIVVFDEESTDKTRQIAKSFGAKVVKVPHEANFHITKQKAMSAGTGKWLLQLDADEALTPELAKEISHVVSITDSELKEYQELQRFKYAKLWKLFMRHQKLIEARDGGIGRNTGEIVAFFIPRRNMFLGKPLIHAGVYPDAVIRLVKKGKAFLPAKSVHEQMVVGGEVGWLFADLLHMDSPTLSRYVTRLNRYTNLHAGELAARKVPKNALYLLVYTTYQPLRAFANLYLRHRGYLDGLQGFIWTAFSAFHFPIAYFKYWTGEYNTNYK